MTADLPPLLYHFRYDCSQLWLRPECFRSAAKQSRERDPFRGYWSDICGHRDGCCKMVIGSVSAAHYPFEGTQGLDLDRHGFAHGSECVYLLCVLAAVHTACVSLGSEHSRRNLPG